MCLVFDGANLNIFATDNCYIKSAVCLDDKRLIKMILESTQLLCTAINYVGGSSPYKSTHVNHPCSKWARESKYNFLWLLCHAFILCAEYNKRFSKTHKCEEILCQIQHLASLFPDIPQTDFVNCTIYKDVQPTTEAYKKYLNYKWRTDKRVPKWTNSNKPIWAQI